MLTVFLASLSSYIDQLSSAVSKDLMDAKDSNLDVWSSAFVSLTLGSVFIFLALILNYGLSDVTLDAGYVWTYIPRIILELVQMYTTYTALKISDLSTFGFIRILTVVLIVVLDFVLMGIILKPLQYAGIAIVLISIFTIFRSKKSNLTGWHYSAISAVNGAVLIILTRFQFNHVNPFLNETIVRLVCIFIILIGLVIAKKAAKSLPRKIFWLIPFRSLTGLLNLLALNFGNSSVYATTERGGSVVSAVLVGHSYFKEKSYKQKLFVSLAICIGIVFLLA